MITALAALLFSLQQDKTYEADARILVERNDLGSSLVGIGGGVPTDPDREAATILELLEQPALARAVADENPDLGLDAGALADKVRGEAAGNSSVISVVATDGDPERAARIADAYAEEFVAFRERQARARVERALAGVESRLRTAERNGRDVTAIRLRRQREEVALLASLQTGDAQLVQEASVPTKATGVGVVPNVVLGAILGLLLGIGLAFLRDRFDSRIKRPEEVEQVFPGVPTIGYLPSWRARRGATTDAESFRALPTTLSSLDPQRTIRTLLVTSATVGEGKSTTSLNLALAMAEREEHVVLLEGDLRRRGLSERLGLEHRAGMSNVLRGEGDMDQYMVDVSVNGAPIGSGRRRNGNSNGTATAVAMRGIVQLLPAGPVPANPHALLRGRDLDELLEEATSNADRVVIDGTPVGLVTDMLPIASRVDGVLVVVHLQYTSRGDLRRLAQQLKQIGVEPYGLVFFGVKMDRSYDAYLGR